MIKVTHKGNFKKTDRFLLKILKFNIQTILDKYGKMGVEALAAATPTDSGATAASWGYETKITPSRSSIYWTNSSVNKCVNIAVILQYGHGTGTGGWVQGRDYINPAMQPIFDEIAEQAWKEVTRK